MVGFEERKSDLDALDISVVAASVDAVDKAREVADEVSFPVAYGVTREQADRFGAWWEKGRGIIQPSEFILDRTGKVVHSSYSAGPLARTRADEVLSLAGLLIKYQKK